MKDVVSHILDTGMDIGTRSSLKVVLMRLGYEVNLVDQVYIRIKNDANLDGYLKVPYDKRAAFFPQCLRNVKVCRAELTEEGYACAKCGSCEIARFKAEAEALGYGGFYVVPGASMVFKIMKRRSFKAALGVACYFELADAVEKSTLFHIPCHGVPLLRDGCKDTIVDVDDVMAAMRRRR
jgi:hypothetical protein